MGRGYATLASFVALFFTFLALAQAALLPPFPAPAVFWSNQGHFTGKLEQCLASVDETEISGLVSFVAGSSDLSFERNVLSRYVNHAAVKSPEVVVVFVEPEASATREAYSFLQTFVGSAVSSLTVPYAYPQASVSSEISNNINHAVHLSGVSSQEEQILNYFRTYNTILTNDKTDVIVIDVHNGDASLIASVEKLVSGSRYVLAYTADSGFRPHEKSVRMVTLDDLESDIVVERAYGGDYWPADVWAGLIISVTLLVLLALGVSCMFELQTPTKWEKQKHAFKEIN